MNQHITRYKTENGKTHRVNPSPAKTGNKNSAPDVNSGAEINLRPDTQPSVPAK